LAETLIALFFAHVLADYGLQWRWLATNKDRGWVLVLHVGIVAVATALAVGHLTAWPVYLLALVHLLVDLAKSRLMPDGIVAHLGDQAAHLLTIVAIALVAPDLWATGFWAKTPPIVPQLMLIAAGAVYASWAGQFVVATVLGSGLGADGLRPRGRMTGLAERALVYGAILIGQPLAAALVFAVKGLTGLRARPEIGPARDRLILGTLASFAWAFAVALPVEALLSHLVGPAPLP